MQGKYSSERCGTGICGVRYNEGYDKIAHGVKHTRASNDTPNGVDGAF
jgi:hypothetical protein